MCLSSQRFWIFRTRRSVTNTSPDFHASGPCPLSEILPWSAFPSFLSFIVRKKKKAKTKKGSKRHEVSWTADRGVSGWAVFPTGALSKPPHLRLRGPAMILWHLHKDEGKGCTAQESGLERDRLGERACLAGILRLFMVTDNFENSMEATVPPHWKPHLCTS